MSGPQRWLVKNPLGTTETTVVVDAKDYDTLHQAFKLAMKELHVARKFIEKCKAMVKDDQDTTILEALDEVISDRDELQ